MSYIMNNIINLPWVTSGSSSSQFGGKISSMSIDPGRNHLYVGGDILQVSGVDSISGINQTYQTSSLMAIDLNNNTVLPWQVKTSGSSIQEVGGVFFHQDSIYFYGNFNSVSGNNGRATRNCWGAADINGNILPWNPKVNGTPSVLSNAALAVDPSLQRLYMAGSFNVVNGANITGLIAVDLVSGTRIESFTSLPSVNSFGSSILCVTVEQNTNNVYIGGNFSTIGGFPASGIAKFDMYGNRLPFSGGVFTTTNNYISNIICYNDAVYVSGRFTGLVGGVCQTGLAAFSSSGSVLPYNPKTTSLTSRTFDNPSNNTMFVRFIPSGSSYGDTFSGVKYGGLVILNKDTGEVEQSWLPVFTGLVTNFALVPNGNNVYFGYSNTETFNGITGGHIGGINYLSDPPPIIPTGTIEGQQTPSFQIVQADYLGATAISPYSNPRYINPDSLLEDVNNRYRQ